MLMIAVCDDEMRECLQLGRQIQTSLEQLNIPHIDLCAGHGILLRGAGFYMFGMDRIDIEQKQKNQYRSQVVFYRMLEEQYRNLLDNALEACRRMSADSDRFIKVHAHMVKKCLLIEVANSTAQSGTGKDGTGLRNVRTAAEKYNGTLQLAEQDNIEAQKKQETNRTPDGTDNIEITVNSSTDGNISGEGAPNGSQSKSVKLNVSV